MSALHVLSPREASIFACLVDTVVAPGEGLPPVAGTDAVVAFDRSLRSAPAVNRAGLRAALLALEVAPLLGRAPRGVPRARLRRLGAADRTAVLVALDRDPVLAPLVKALRALASLHFYGDDGVMRTLGYDADAIVARGAALRAAEGRW